MRRTSLLSLACAAALLCLLAFPVLGWEELIEDAEKKRAAISKEEIEKQLRENTITDADLLPTLPPEKAYTPTGEPEHALLITPGRGKPCEIKKLPNLIDFLRDEAKYYPTLLVDYIIAGNPKLKFYTSAEHRASSIVHGAEMSEDDILSLLQRGPDESREPLQSFELKDDPEVKEIKHWLERHNVQRAEQPDENHSSQYIFKPDFVPEEEN